MCTGAEIAFAFKAFSVASTALQVTNTLQAGKAAQEAALARQAALEHQAKQARQNAGQERAASQRASKEQRRQAQLVESRALAVAAASGAGAADPTVENILGGIGAEGEFRALSELFIGEERARGLEFQADIKVFEGNQERRAGDIARRLSRTKAAGQVFGGGAKLLKSFKDEDEDEPKKRRTPKTTLSSGRGLR